MPWHLDMSVKINSQVFVKLILKGRGMTSVIHGPWITDLSLPEARHLGKKIVKTSSESYISKSITYLDECHNFQSSGCSHVPLTSLSIQTSQNFWKKADHIFKNQRVIETYSCRHSRLKLLSLSIVLQNLYHFNKDDSRKRQLLELVKLCKYKVLGKRMLLIIKGKK